MDVIQLLITIVVVTILVTIVLAIVTYVAYKLRLAREPATARDESGPRYFVLYEPPDPSGATGGRVSAGSPVATSPPTEQHAT
jgi:hypothetical protein